MGMQAGLLVFGQLEVFASALAEPGARPLRHYSFVLESSISSFLDLKKNGLFKVRDGVESPNSPSGYKPIIFGRE